MASHGNGVRLAELMAVLSMASDMAMGQPVEFAMQSCIVAMRLGELAGLPAAQLQDVYYESLLRYIGCNADSHWLGSIIGDEIDFRQQIAALDSADDMAVLGVVLRAIRARHTGEGPVGQLQAIARGMAQMPQVKSSYFPGHCEVASRLAMRLGFAPSFVQTIGQLYARWDGKGTPALKGHQISPALLVVSLAQDAVTFWRLGGTPKVLRMTKERRGKAHAPQLCDLFKQHVDALLDGLDTEPTWPRVMALEPGMQRVLSPQELDSACEAIADFIDLKSPQRLGHSRRVADVVYRAAQHMGLDTAQCSSLRRAAWLHDLGRAGISATVAESPGGLSARQQEFLRLHPYHTQRLLDYGTSLADLGRLASMHHERLDGSGDYRGLSAQQIPVPARLLAAADQWCALLEGRPGQAAMLHAPAAQHFQVLAQQGQLDGHAVHAVLACEGLQALAGKARLPANLTARELQVLRLLARGATLKVVARELDVAVKTVDRHVQNVYTKINVSTRAAATLFAVENQLLD